MNLDELSIASLDQEISEYEKNLETLPEPIFSNRHYRIIRKATRVSKEKKTIKQIEERRAKVFKKAFAVALIAALIMVTTVVAFAKMYPNYFMVIKKKMTEWTVTFVAEDDEGEDVETTEIEGDVPGGFSISSRTCESRVKTIVYSADNDKSKQIIFVEQEISEASSVGLDAETEYDKKIRVNGNCIIETKKEDCYTFFWVAGNCAYTLVGNCEEDILIKYVETIK